jgi:hypothetical protein
MTPADSSLPFPWRPFSAEVINQWGHWAAQVLSGTICATILLRVWSPEPAGAVSILAPPTLVAVVLTSWLLMRRHDRRLCEHCMTDMPLNPSDSAARYHRRLATAHLGSNKVLAIGYLTVLVGSALLPGTRGLVIWSLAQASMIYLLICYTTHRRLQPWCPACRGDGDGIAKSPDPAPRGFQNA